MCSTNLKGCFDNGHTRISNIFSSNVLAAGPEEALSAGTLEQLRISNCLSTDLAVTEMKRIYEPDHEQTCVLHTCKNKGTDQLYSRTGTSCS